MRLIILLAMASVAVAGPTDNLVNNVTEIWSNQGLTTSTVTSTNSYRVGSDQEIVADIQITNLGSTESVTLRAVYSRFGGNNCGYALPYDEDSDVVITEGTDATEQILLLSSPPPGADLMYVQGTTSDSTSCTVSIEVFGGK